MIFIDWLFSLGHSFPQITRAAADTLAGVYTNLTGKTSAWPDFMAAVANVQINDDDPFQRTAMPWRRPALGTWTGNLALMWRRRS
jgi:hypothetical protein